MFFEMIKDLKNYDDMEINEYLFFLIAALIIDFFDNFAKAAEKLGGGILKIKECIFD